MDDGQTARRNRKEAKKKMTIGRQSVCIVWCGTYGMYSQVDTIVPYSMQSRYEYVKDVNGFYIIGIEGQKGETMGT